MKFTTLWGMMALACVGLVAARASTEYPLYGIAIDQVEAPPEEVIYRVKNLDDRGFNRVVQAISQPTLTVYHPEAARADRAALVICPGGGYRYVVVDREGHMLARYFQQRGFTVAVLKYRLPKPDAMGPNELPLSQQDALEALRFVRRHAAEWNVNPQRVGIMGASAGGHLACSIGVFGRTEDQSRPDFVAALYPVITLGEPLPHVHTGSRTQLLGETPVPALVAKYSLHLQARADLPPYFFVHAKDDKAVPPENSEMMANALAKVGVRAKCLLVDSGGHGFALGRGKASSIWPEQFLAWLDTVK